jgi:MYXO-CTERM domain-containing protein
VSSSSGRRSSCADDASANHATALADTPAGCAAAARDARPARPIWWLAAAALALAAIGSPLSADNLPPAPTELGTIRRNEQGQLEVVRPPAASPAAASSPVETPAARRAGSQRVAADGQPGVAGSGRTIVVGEREAVRSISEAARLARDGDTIEIRPGEYRRQAVVWTQDRLTIRGVGRRPVLIADGDSAEGKALWVVRSAQMTIDNLEFRGVRVAAGNGAGIRFESGHLKVVRCAFFDNEMGILTSNAADAVLEVENSEFGAAPRHAGALHHLLYAGTIARLKVSGSRFQQGYLGHLIKSRARESSILYNLLVDGVGGSASYELEFPNGGIAWVIGNIIGQSATTDNPVVVSYGAEGERWPDNALHLAHNTLVDDTPGGRFLQVWSERLPAVTEVWAINNLLVGRGIFAPQGTGRHDGNQSVEAATLVDVDGLPFVLPQASPLRGRAKAPGFARGQSLAPTAEFRLPAKTLPLLPGKPLSPGALQ